MAGTKSAGRRMKNLVSSAKRAAGSGQAAATSGPVGAMPVQVGNRLTKTSKDVGKVRSGSGKAKGALTGDRLDEIATLLDRYHQAQDSASRQPILAQLYHVCETYLFDHTGLKDQAYRGDEQKVALIEDVFAEVRLEMSRGQAQQAYLDDALGNEREVRTDDGEGTEQSAKFALKHQTTSNNTFRNTTHEMMTGSRPGPAFDLVKKYDLTEAEVVAIRTFTAQDYRYINPATANSTSRMTGYMAGKGKDEKQREGLIEEGTLHTGVAMQGLAKLPKMHGKVYRGALLTPTDFAKEYFVGNTVTFPSLTSTSVKRTEADDWAGKDGGDKTVHYVATLNVTNARDIQNLAIIKGEEEWVLLPGATFVVKAVKKDESKGLAAGHVWYEIELQQTK